jgi:hypothetical protein
VGRRRPRPRDRPTDEEGPLMERFLYALGIAASFAALAFAIYHGTS